VDYNDILIVDDLVTKCIRRFTSTGYMVQIFPIEDNFAVMAMKIGKQGAHYLDKSLENCFVQLLGHMQNNDDELKEK